MINSTVTAIEKMLYSNHVGSISLHSVYEIHRERADVADGPDRADSPNASCEVVKIIIAVGPCSRVTKNRLVSFALYKYSPVFCEVQYKLICIAYFTGALWKSVKEVRLQTSR